MTKRNKEIMKVLDSLEICNDKEAGISWVKIESKKKALTAINKIIDEEIKEARAYQELETFAEMKKKGKVK